MKFNQSAATAINLNQTRNHEGAVAFALSPMTELYSAVVTTMLSDAFYESGDARLARIRALVAVVDPVFVAKLAVYAREQMNLRTAPVMLAVELARIHNGDDLVARTVARVVQRPDEITELLAYYSAVNERKDTKKLNRLSKQVQKGLAMAFNRFDEYQFAKYNRDTAVRLRDALFLVHPTAKDVAQQAIFDKLVSNTLQTPYTWETELSLMGQLPYSSEAEKLAAVGQTWQALIESQKMGYMATLRNLRNMVQAQVSEQHLNTVAAYLADPKNVARSKQLPFRFLAAWRELAAMTQAGQDERSIVQRIADFARGRLHTMVEISGLMNALETAVGQSASALRGFDAETRVVVACDVSGSMQQPVSPKSKVLLYDIGLLLGMVLRARCKNVLCGMFGDTWKVVDLPESRVLANVNEFYKREGEVGYSTNGHLVLAGLVKRKHIADKVMVFTDCQLWNTNQGQRTKSAMAVQWAAYKKIAPNAKLYLFDLAGYGTTPLQVLADDVHLIAGWSDKVFDVLESLEAGQDSLARVNEIVL